MTRPTEHEPGCPFDPDKVINQCHCGLEHRKLIFDLEKRVAELEPVMLAAKAWREADASGIPGEEIEQQLLDALADAVDKFLDPGIGCIVIDAANEAEG